MSDIYTTCFASGQTVATGDRCYLLPVRRSHGFKPVAMTHDGASFAAYGSNYSTSGPDAFWSPIGDFIEAEYRDYIDIRPVHTPVNADRLRHLIRRVAFESAVTAQGANSVHDAPFDINGFINGNCPSISANLEASRKRPMWMDDRSPIEFTELLKAWDYLMWGCNRHRAFMMDYDEPFELQLGILHGLAYDGLISAMEKRTTYDDLPLDRRSYFDRAVQASEVEMTAEDREKIESATLTGDPMEIRRASYGLLYQRDSLFRDHFKQMGAMECISYPGEAHAFRDGLLDFFEGKLAQDQLYELLLPSLNSRYVMASLSSLNLHVSPMRMGRRDRLNEVGNAFAAFVKETSKAVHRERKQRRMACE